MLEWTHKDNTDQLYFFWDYKKTVCGIEFLYLFVECFPVDEIVKNLPAMQKTLEKGMATYFSILEWRTPETEESGGRQSMGSQRIRHDWGTNSF